MEKIHLLIQIENILFFTSWDIKSNKIKPEYELEYNDWPPFLVFYKIIWSLAMFHENEKMELLPFKFDKLKL
jgi:hypothetical protein